MKITSQVLVFNLSIFDITRPNVYNLTRFGRVIIMTKNTNIIGREYEMMQLDDCMSSNVTQLIIVYGRRRVGKTFLINNYFNNKFAFKITGSLNQNKSQQLNNFIEELNGKTNKKYDNPKSWQEAFNYLKEYLQSLSKKQKQVIFIDEMPWLDNHKSGFLASFEWFYNHFASTMNNLVFIVCGSATSWMIDKFNNNSGLYNRHTGRIYLEPFNLYETKQFLKAKGINWNDYDIAQCYMVMGGIPYYLNLLNKRYSYRQNIDNLFFKQHSTLFDEFEHLYSSLFSSSDGYIKVIEAISKKNSGLSRNEIIDISGLPTNGALSKILNDLVYSGFLKANKMYNNKKKETVYQLSDYYSLFYLRFIKNNYGKDEYFWSNTIDNPSQRAWAGYTFELLCKDHIRQIKQKLGIAGVLSSQSSWRSKSDEQLNTDGCQIDLLIDRRDMTINICEMKFSINEFVIDKNYDQILRNKIEAFNKLTDNKKSLQLTMITTFGVKQNKYSNIIQNEVLLEDLFIK